MVLGSYRYGLLGIAPFVRAHTLTFYSKYAPFLRYSEIIVENHRFYLPHLYIGVSVGGGRIGISPRSLAPED